MSPADSGLSRERIGRAALALADEHGLDALSMRRLAEELDVGTMTLYGYVRGKDELLDAIVDAAMEDVEPPQAGGTWREQACALVWAARRNLLRHPALVQIRLRRPILRPEALRTTEAAMGLLVQAGFTSGEAAQAFRILFIYTFGSVAFNAPASPEAGAQESARALTELPAEEYPSLRAAAGDLPTTMSGDEQFVYGLERILDGFEARLAATAAHSR